MPGPVRREESTTLCIRRRPSRPGYADWMALESGTGLVYVVDGGDGVIKHALGVCT